MRGEVDTSLLLVACSSCMDELNIWRIRHRYDDINSIQRVIKVVRNDHESLNELNTSLKIYITNVLRGFFTIYEWADLLYKHTYIEKETR